MSAFNIHVFDIYIILIFDICARRKYWSEK